MFKIGACTVDATLDEIAHDGNKVKIEPRAMRVLMYLVHHAGAVVSVEELLNHVWADLVVTPDSVYTTIAALRRALGDDSKVPRYIANVPRRGYRLIAPVEPVIGPEVVLAAPPENPPPAASIPEVTKPPAPHRPARRWWAAAASMVALLAVVFVLVEKPWVARRQVTASASAPVMEKSIAVLPFLDMSEKHDQAYFSDGLSEELIDMLTKVPGLHVPARTSSFYFKDKQTTISDIARELGVAHVLEGSVRKSGNNLRVTAQLIRVDTGFHVWSQTYDRELDDIFKIQDEIAAAVVSALKVQLDGGRSALRTHGTTNPEAYNAYLLGRQYYSQNTVPTLHEAVNAYETAIRLDPNYAEAYAELAVAQFLLAENVGDAALWQLAEQTAQKAIDLDSQQTAGYLVRGTLRYLHRYDWAGAESDFRQALALEPTSIRALTYYGKLLSYVGRTKEATAAFRNAIEQDPLQVTDWQNLGIALAKSGDHAGAYDAYRHALAIQPRNAHTVFALGTLQLVDGKAREALATFQGDSDEEFRGAGVAMAEYTLGDAGASQQALDKLIAAGAGDAAYQIAEVYAWRGEKDRAFEWLERAYRQHDGGLSGIQNDLRLAPLYSDPRYAAMLRKLNFPPVMHP